MRFQNAEMVSPGHMQLVTCLYGEMCGFQLEVRSIVIFAPNEEIEEREACQYIHNIICLMLDMLMLILMMVGISLHKMDRV
jgi:hypothetical protein